MVKSVTVDNLDYAAKVVEVEGRWIVTTIWFGVAVEIFTGTRARCESYAQRI